MRKLLSCLILLLFAAMAYCQVISGIVYDSETKIPIPYTAVYISGTLVGTSSDENGVFELDIAEHKSKAISIRAIGYETLVLDAVSGKKDYKIYLTHDLFEIEEVRIGAKNLERKRKANLKIFKREFLGSSGNQKLCEIINEEDITFNYGFDKDTLKAFARNPIKIVNGALGYVVTYYLDKFEYVKRSKLVSFTGDIVFNEDLAVDHSVEGYYSENRADAYLGSSMHFFRALWNNSLEMDGFTIVKNPLDLSTIEHSMAKVTFPDITYEDVVVTVNEDQKFLLADEGLHVYYEQKNSKMYFLKPKVLFGENGFYDPSGIVWYGYMASQRIGVMLPYDYILVNYQ